MLDSFKDCEYSYPKIWSESNVSEDFRLFLDLVKNDYFGRYISYTGNEFKEGVSLCYVDELGKFKKYTYGTCEILFNPIWYWLCGCFCGHLCRTPINKTIIHYLSSKIDFSSKLNLMGYLFTYIAMSCGVFMCFLNYFLYGWYEMGMIGLVLPLDIFIQILLLFTVWGLLSHTITLSRLKKRFSCQYFWNDAKYILLYFFFFGSLQYHLSKVIMIYCFCPNAISWGSTNKEIELKNKKQAICETFRNFLDMYIIFFLTIIMVVIMALPIIPDEWRITSVQSIAPLIITSLVHMIAPMILNPHITSDKLRIMGPIPALS
jgi:hypothetical protein